MSALAAMLSRAFKKRLGEEGPATPSDMSEIARLGHVRDSSVRTFSDESILYLEVFEPMIIPKILIIQEEALRKECEALLICT